MTYQPSKQLGGSSLLTHEQKLKPQANVGVDEPSCCCRNEGKPYLLGGIMVRSLSPSCKIHAKSVLKWLGSEPIEFDVTEGK